VNYSQSKGPAEDLVARLKQSGSPESVAIGADVSDPAQAARLIEETVKQFGRIDVLVNNAGIIGFTRSATLELARYNVTANVVAPGFTRSEMYESIPGKTKVGILAQIPLSRVCDHEEVARAVRFLVVDGDYITGTTLNISWGIYLQ